jgi:hypothetical protein
MRTQRAKRLGLGKSNASNAIGLAMYNERPERRGAREGLESLAAGPGEEEPHISHLS